MVTTNLKHELKWIESRAMTLSTKLGILRKETECLRRNDALFIYRLGRVINKFVKLVFVIPVSFSFMFIKLWDRVLSRE